MKNITATILTLAMLASLTACGENSDTPATTTAPADTTTTTTTTAPVTETVDIEALLEGYTLHQMTSEELEAFRKTFPEDSALGKIAIEVTDYDGLYLLIEDEGITENNDGGYDRAKVRRVICGDVVQDCDITFAFGPYRFDLIKTDEYTVVGNQGYSSHFIVFGEDSCGEIPFSYGRDGACPWLKEENGQLCYRIENPIITKTFGDLRKILDTVTSEDEWRYEWGTVSLDGNNVIFTKTKEQSMRDDDFLRDLFVPGDQFETLEELLEYNRLKAEPFDVNAFIADATVYEVTTEKVSYQKPYMDLEKLDISKRSERIALRFTDAEGLTILMEIADDGYYYDKHIFNDNISVSIDEDRFAYGQRGFFVGYNNGVTIVQDGENPYVKYHIFKGTDYEVLENDATESGYALDIYLSNDNEWIYSKGDWKYHTALSISGLIDVYESEDDFYCEHGWVSFVNGKVMFEQEYTMTIGEYYKSDSFTYRESKEKYDAETFAEYAELYRQFVSEGRENEFY